MCREKERKKERKKEREEVGEKEKDDTYFQLCFQYSTSATLAIPRWLKSQQIIRRDAASIGGDKSLTEHS